MSEKQNQVSKEMECLAMVKYENGYWLHGLSDRLSYLYGEDFVSLVDSEAGNNKFGWGGGASLKGWWRRTQGTKAGPKVTKLSMGQNKQSIAYFW